MTQKSTTNAPPAPVLCAYCAVEDIDEVAVRWVEGDPNPALDESNARLVRRLHGLYWPACFDCAENAIEDGARIAAMSESERKGYLR